MRQIPTIDTGDPQAISKALRSIEVLLQELGIGLDLLREQRPIIPLDEVKLPPDNSPVPLSIVLNAEANGSMSVVLGWSYIQGQRPATQFIVYVKKGAAPLAVPTYEDSSFSVPVTAKSIQLDSLAPLENYRFGIAAARSGKTGLIIGPIQAPTANPDWADISLPNWGPLAKYGQNQCPNADFETPNYFWGLVVASGAATGSFPVTDPKYGLRHGELVVSATGNCYWVGQSPNGGEAKAIPVVGGQTYSFAAWGKRVSGTGTLDLTVSQWNSVGGNISNTSIGTTTSSSWVRISGELVLNASAAFVSVRLGTLTSGTGTFRIDGVQVVRGLVADIPDFDGAQLDKNPFVPDSNLAQAWLGSRLLANGAAQGSDVTLTEATWVSVNSVSLTIPVEATTTKVLLTASANLGITITTAGIFNMLWRWKRDTTVLYTSNLTRYDSNHSLNFNFPIGSFLDSVGGGGTFVYSLEMFKDDIAPANNAVVSKTGNQISVFPWMN